MLNDGRAFVLVAPHSLPGLAIMVTVSDSTFSVTGPDRLDVRTPTDLWR
jgi:hypothetical protein